MMLCFFVFEVYLLALYICVLRSESGHVYLLKTLVYLLKLLHVNSCMVWQSCCLKPFYVVRCMCSYIFLQLFVRRIVPWIWLGIMRHRNVHSSAYYYQNEKLIIIKTKTRKQKQDKTQQTGFFADMLTMLRGS